MSKLPGLRWLIAALLFGAAVLNYIDRQTLSLLAPTIQRDLGMDEAAYGNVVNGFLIAYIISYLFSGKLVDKFGTRAAYGVFVGFWSVANMLTGFARSAGSLGGFRFLLGLGEAGNWTASPKAVSEWFPAGERGLAIGIYTMGATIGATIAPLLIVTLAGRYGWQMTFVATGALGLLWLVPWLWLYRLPQFHPRITTSEREMIAQSQAAEEAAAPIAGEDAWTWKSLLVRKEVWLLMLGRMLTDPVWYFYQFWFAKYLFSVRGVAQEDLKITWIVFLAADFGSLLGGWISGRFIKRGATPAAGRLRTMLGCALFMPLAPLIAFVPSTNAVLALAVLVVLAHLAWLINISALVVDLVPRASLGTVFGVVATGSALGGMAMNKLVAWLVTDYSYTPWFVITAFLHPVAWLLLCRLKKGAPTAPALTPVLHA